MAARMWVSFEMENAETREVESKTINLRFSEKS